MKTKCPQCSCEFDAKRSSYGASYALEQKRLTEKQESLLSWWLSSKFYDKKMTKKQLLDESGLVTMDSINARISELKALNLVLPFENNTYQLNIPNTVEVLNKGGLL